MEQIRKPFQGVLNIVRFNWHFYILAIMFFIGLLILKNYTPEYYHFYFSAIIILAVTITFISLLISFYVYDVSDLYKFDWIPGNNDKIRVVNINAGFDETSALLKAKFKNAELIVLDFYNPFKHTEVSIKRARKAYPAFPNTKEVTTSHLTLTDNSIDKIFITLAAHEIRDQEERALFFKEIYRILKPGRQAFVTEHLRDTANFLAYNIGSFHFLSRASWNKTFDAANLIIKEEKKITPFITNFTLQKNGITT